MGADLDRALGDVLGEIADPLEVAGDADGADQFAQIDRHRLTASNGPDRKILDLALHCIQADVGRDDLMRKHRVGARERIHGLDHHLLGDAAHFGDQALDRIEFPVVGFDGVVVHGGWSFCRRVASDGVRLGKA